MPKATDTHIPIWFLIECFIVDATTPSGLRWRERPREHFESGRYGDGQFARWNGRYAGKAAGVKNVFGYMQVTLTFNGVRRSFKVHRVIYALTKGGWPPDQVDHEDRDRSANQTANLREATQGENNQNMGLGSRNESGVKGVRWHKGRRKWRVVIGINERQLQLGDFASFMDACQARWAAEIAHHPFRVREPEPSKPKPFDRVPDGAFVTGCWSIGSNPHWAVIDYA
jgi:HNH endonuclease